MKRNKLISIYTNPMKIGEIYTLKEFKEYVELLRSEGKETINVENKEDCKPRFVRVKITDVEDFLYRLWDSPSKFALKFGKDGFQVTTARYNFK